MYKEAEVNIHPPMQEIPSRLLSVFSFVFFVFSRLYIQAYLRDISGSVPETQKKYILQ